MKPGRLGSSASDLEPRPPATPFDHATSVCTRASYEIGPALRAPTPGRTHTLLSPVNIVHPRRPARAHPSSAPPVSARTIDGRRSPSGRDGASPPFEGLTRTSEHTVASACEGSHCPCGASWPGCARHRHPVIRPPVAGWPWESSLVVPQGRQWASNEILQAIHELGSIAGMQAASIQAD